MELLVTIAAIVAGFFFGSARERRHFAELVSREKLLLQKMPIRADRGPKITSGHTFLVTGNVVIASDAFKNFVGNLKSFFGGKLTSHESLVDRARREAVLRLREKALQMGASYVVDLHVQTSFIDGMGAEVSAYGTAVRT